MKKLIAMLLLAGFMVASTVGCGEEKKPAKPATPSTPAKPAEKPAEKK